MIKITLFAQIVNIFDKNLFKSAVNKYQSDKHSKGINSWTHMLSMIFLHLTRSNSLREVSGGLRSALGNLVHLGIQKSPSKSSLSYLNKIRDWRLFMDYYYIMLNRLSNSFKGLHNKFRIKTKKIKILDASIISMCIEVFDWAKYRQTKGAVKLHTLLDFDSCLPEYMLITDGKASDGTTGHQIPLYKDSLVIADRAYQDFDLLNEWDSRENNFVVRSKKNTQYRVLKKNKLPKNASEEGLISDQIVILANKNTLEKYPKRLRLVIVENEESGEILRLVTNSMTWSAATISKLYKSRWQIEIFFKEIKQHLKIKTFVGTTENAVMIQIWTALISILLLKYLKEISKYGWHLSNLAAFLRLNLLVKIDLQLWLDEPYDPHDEHYENDRQLSLFKGGG